MKKPSLLRRFARLLLGAAFLAPALPGGDAPSQYDIYGGKSTTPYYAFKPTMIAPGTPEIQRRSEASAVNLASGNVLVAWCDLVGKSDNAKGYIVAQELDNMGAPIGKPRILFPTPEGGLNVLSPALRRLKDGSIGVAFSYRISTKNASRQFSVSRDEGGTWSAPVPVSDGSDAYMTGCNDRLTVLDSGRLIAPLHCADDWDKHFMHVRVARSDDNGRTWKTTAQRIERLPMVKWPDARAFIESGCIEPGVAQRADGSLLMTMRTAMGTQFFSESSDQGETWSPPRSLELVSPQAPANLSRIPGSDELLMIWTPDYDAGAGLGGRRNSIMSAISVDGGRSWPHSRRKVMFHDPVHSIDYPSVLYRKGEAWITLRMSSGTHVLEGLTSTALVRAPLAWFRAN